MSLPAPYYQDKWATVYLGDCREILPHLPKVDLVLTDPPYDVHAGFGGGEFGKRAHLVNTGGFTDGGCDYSFLSGFENWFCFCSRKQLPELIDKAKHRARWNLLTWCKPNPVPTCCNKYLPDVEFVVHGFEKGRLFGEMDAKSCFMIVPCGNKTTEHPNEKPIRICTKLVTLGTQFAETVLDPFCGSGSTLCAAKQLSRQSIGIEIDERWAEVAARRLEAETTLFDLAESKIVQPDLLPE